MRTSNIIIAHPDDDKFESLKAFLEALKIKFEIATEKPYDDNFVKMIMKGDEDIKEGRGRRITLDEIDDLWK
jgi:hypothetical protein